MDKQHQEILNDFKIWLQSTTAKKHLEVMDNEKKEVKELIDKLAKLDKNSKEFTDLVLYGLLPYGNTKFAKRVSTFPVFLNIKEWLKNYNYSEADWNKLANMVYTLSAEFHKDPSKLDRWIADFTENKIHARGIQCGSISPILFCLNESYPVVNNRVRHTYNKFSKTFGWDDKISQKLDDYPDNVKKCRKLIKEFELNELNDLRIFDLFCWWYDTKKIIDDEKEEDSDQEIEKYISNRQIEDFNYIQFLDSFDLDDRKKLEPHSLKNPERIKLRDILQNCQDGNWQLPYFQRYFDWKKTDIQSLLDSIVNDYYIGSFLLWEVKGQPPVKIMPIEGTVLPEGAESEASMIILDGQQRISSLYYAIRPDGKERNKIQTPVYFYINFRHYFENQKDEIITQLNKENELITILNRKISRHESIKEFLFPLYELENYDVWVDTLEDYLDETSTDHNKIKDLRRTIEKKLKHIIDGFEIPYIVLPKTMEIFQVADIFERLNTRGKVLNVFDLLIARLLLNNIELRGLWDDVRHTYPKLKEYDSREKIPFYILQAISLVYHKFSSCKQPDILNIYKNIFTGSDLQFEEVWDDMSEYVNKAIQKLENLRDGFGVNSPKHLPYLPTIPILASLLMLVDSRDDKVACNKKISMWYWASVFSENYSSGVDSQLSVDFREMKRWFDDDAQIVKSVEKIRREFQTTLDLHDVKRDNSSTYRGIMSLLALEGAHDFDTNLTVENAAKNDKHHIFPKSTFGNHSDVNSVLNMTWLSEETNRNIIRAKKPSVYVKEFIKTKYNNDESSFLKVLEKHLITKEAYECMLQDDFDGFLKEREKMLLTRIATVLGVNKKTTDEQTISPDTEFDNLIAIESVISQCTEHIHWVDKYFRNNGLKWLRRYSDKNKVKEIKVLTSIDTADDDLRDHFKAFKKQMEKENITCHMKVLTDSKLKSIIHDRWIITKGNCFNIPSVDTVSRGQFSQIKDNVKAPPFEKWWDGSLDIIDDWNKIVNEKNRESNSE